jgi:hypothetical protein
MMRGLFVALTLASVAAQGSFGSFDSFADTGSSFRSRPGPTQPRSRTADKAYRGQ